MADLTAAIETMEHRWWRKGRVRRGWRLVQRVLGPLDENADVPRAIRALQLWR